MDHHQIIAEWNSMMEQKILPYDLQKPSPKFIMDAVCCYLQKENLNVQKMKTKSSSLYLFRINLCYHINKLLGTNEFRYRDLIDPSPQRTCKLLADLLNMYSCTLITKESVCADAKMTQLHLEAAQRDNNQLRIKHEELNSLNANSQRQLKDNTKLSKHLVLKIEELTNQDKRLAEEITHITNNVHDHEEQLLRLTDQKLRREQLLVDDEEIVHLKDREQSLTNELQEINDELKVKKADSALVQQNISNIEPQIKILNDVLAHFTEHVEEIAEIRKSKLTLNELKKNLDTTKLRIIEKEKKRKVLEQKLATISEDCLKFQMSLDNETISVDTATEELSSKINAQMARSDQTTKYVVKVEEDIALELEIHKYVAENEAIILSYIKDIFLNVN